MAELNTSPTKKEGTKTRQSHSLRVDLTAMVDLAFLLVTFFMLTTTLTKPRAMDLAMPVDETDPAPVAQSRSVTLCLGKNNQVLLYQGMVGENEATVVNFSKNGLRRALIELKTRIKTTTGKDAVVLVKPSSQSQYGNLVNTLDELQITQNTRYAIVDITAKDVNLLKSKSLF